MKAFLEMIICCDQRRRDRMIIKEYLEANGIAVQDTLEGVDFAVLITCSVTLMTQGQSDELIKKTLEVLPKEKVIDVGCYLETRPDKTKEYGIYCVPPKNHEMLDDVMVKAGFIKELKVKFNDMKFNGRFNEDDQKTWFISLGEGCSLQGCSYCVKSKATGKLTDCAPEEILGNFKLGIEKGYTKFRFIGEDTAAYGKTYNMNFPQLVNYLVDNVPDSCKPVHFNTFMNGMNPYQLEMYEDEFYELLKREDVIFDGMQIAVQTFNENLVRICHRPGSPDNWIRIIKNIKEIMPACEIWLQLITGIPTEKKEEVQHDIEILRQLPIEVIHIYGYSHNKGSYFYENYEYDQDTADDLFQYTIDELEKNGEKIVYHANRSIVVTHFDRLPINEENGYYHKYRYLY